MTELLLPLVRRLAAAAADLAPALCAAALHEAGHLAACRALGVPLRRFRLSPFGAVIDYDASRLAFRQEILIAAAGPVANLLGVLACLPGPCGRRRALFGVSCLALAFFNLLPIRTLDGGTILAAALEARLSWPTAARAARAVSAVFSALLFAAAAAAQLRSGGSLSLLALSVWLLTRIVTDGG